jgi:hypothetical protein
LNTGENAATLGNMTVPAKAAGWRLQFHLATAIILTLVTGAWIGLNVRSETDFTGGPIILPGTEGLASTAPEPLRVVRRSFGLPYPFLIILYRVPFSFCDSGRSPVGIHPNQGWRFEPGALAIDLLVLLGLLLFVGVTSEWWLRRGTRSTD